MDRYFGYEITVPRTCPSLTKCHSGASGVEAKDIRIAKFISIISVSTRRVSRIELRPENRNRARVKVYL